MTGWQPLGRPVWSHCFNHSLGLVDQWQNLQWTQMNMKWKHATSLLSQQEKQSEKSETTSPQCVFGLVSHYRWALWGKKTHSMKIRQNKSLAEALHEFISGCFQGYRTTGCVTHLHSTQRGLTGEIFPSTVAQAQGFIILSLARLQQCHPVEERDRGNISEEGSAHWGLTPGPPWERRDSLFREPLTQGVRMIKL